MPASRWSARSDARRWRKSRAAAYPEHPAGPFSDIAAFSALRAAAVAHGAIAVGPRTRADAAGPAPRHGTFEIPAAYRGRRGKGGCAICFWHSVGLSGTAPRVRRRLARGRTIAVGPRSEPAAPWGAPSE